MSQRTSLILGALLHDIGKLGQRASPGDTGLSPETLGLVGQICQSSHRHVLWTDEFIARRFTRWPSGVSVAEVANLASYHHAPRENPLEVCDFIVQEADHLSAGMDRSATDTDADAHTFRRTYLRPVFLRLWHERHPAADGSIIHTLSPLDPSALASSFPAVGTSAHPPDGADLTPLYAQLWENLINAANATQADSPEAIASHILSLLEIYTSCIPSATNDKLKDISLFDHLKTTAAIATALYDHHHAANNMTPAAVKDHNIEKFVLVGGDLSGIQPYIFELANVGVGGTAKRLRARSFYVSCLAEVACHKILRTFDLPRCNVLLQSGGRFYVLLPLLPDTEARLRAIEHSIDAWCQHEIAGQIAVNLAWVSAKPTELETFPELLRRLQIRLSESKHRALSAALIADGRWVESAFVRSISCSHEDGICTVCGKEPADAVDEESAERSGPRCRQDRDIGSQLPRTKYIAFYESPDEGRFQVLDHSFGLFVDDRIPGTPYLVVAVNHIDLAPVSRHPVAFRFIAKHIPVAGPDSCTACDQNEACDVAPEDRPRPGQPLFFQCLALRSRGRRSLAFLKGDVDHLGKTFCFGFPEPERSISRVTALSRSLDLFFSGYVEQLLAAEFPETYTVFSGGDDFLLVGPWDRMLDLAARLQADFHRFTIGRLTLSAGAVLARPRSPVAIAVELADQALEQSKEHKATGATESRNQFTAFGTTIKWPQLAPNLSQARQLSDWLEDGILNMGACRRLFYYAELYRLFEQKGETQNLRFVPLLAYDLARNWPKPDDPAAVKRDARAWAERLRRDAMNLGSADGAWPSLRFVLEYALNTQRTR